MRTRCIGQTDRERMISSRTRSFAPSPSSIYGSLEFRRLWDGARDLGDLALEDEAYERSIVGVDCEFYPGDRRSICALAYSPPYRRWLRGRLGS